VDTAWVGGITMETNAPNQIRVQAASYYHAIDHGNGTPPDLVSAVRLNDVAGQDTAFCRDRPVLLGFNRWSARTCWCCGIGLRYQEVEAIATRCGRAWVWGRSPI
jgi:hypothetical protein